jgi:hypothetical protein
MRAICLSMLILALGAAAAAEDALDPRAQRVVEDYREELATAADRYRQAVAEAQADAVTGLKRQIRSSTPVPARVQIMREVLRINPDETEARAFFEVLGTLEAELAAVQGEAPAETLAVDLLDPGPATAGPEVLRRLVAASPAAEALAAAYTADPKAPIHAAFAGFDGDQVGSSASGVPNGRADGRIDLLVVADV